MLGHVLWVLFNIFNSCKLNVVAIFDADYYYLSYSY